MSGFSKKSIDKYIRNRIKYWIYDLGRNAHLYLKEELKLSTNEVDQLTEEDKANITRFQTDVMENVIVTGGCFTSMLLGEQPNDLDLYIRSQEVAINITNFYLNRMRTTGNLVETEFSPRIEAQTTEDGVAILIKSQGITGEDINSEEYRYFEAHPWEATDRFFKQYQKNMGKNLEGKRYDVSFMTSNAITLNGGIQIIIRFTGDPETIHSNFDFIHATNYWTWDEGVVYNAEALRATHEKRLYYFGSKFPVASIFRLKKFVDRGWRISAGEIVKILFDVSNLDLTDISVLREQSMGMDSAYFNEVIAILTKQSDKEIDRTYLFNAIEIAFNMSDKQDDFLDSQSNEEEPPVDEDQFQFQLGA